MSFLLAQLPLPILLGLITFVGLCLGSFLTCVAYRVPRGLSLWRRRRSFCPQCHHTLGMTELVPVFSYLWQRGRCRHCHAPIGRRYVLIELGTLALTFLLAALTLF